MRTTLIIPPALQEFQQLGREFSDIAIKASQTTPRFVLSISGEVRSHIVNYAKARAAIRSLDPEIPGGAMVYLYAKYDPNATSGGGFRVNLLFNTPENCDKADDIFFKILTSGKPLLLRSLEIYGHLLGDYKKRISRVISALEKFAGEVRVQEEHAELLRIFHQIFDSLFSLTQKYAELFLLTLNPSKRANDVSGPLQSWREGFNSLVRDFAQAKHRYEKFIDGGKSLKFYFDPTLPPGFIERRLPREIYGVPLDIFFAEPISELCKELAVSNTGNASTIVYQEQVELIILLDHLYNHCGLTRFKAYGSDKFKGNSERNQSLVEECFNHLKGFVELVVKHLPLLDPGRSAKSEVAPQIAEQADEPAATIPAIGVDT